MGKYPLRTPDPPSLDDKGHYVVTTRTVMACNAKIKGTATHKDLQYAYNRANAIVTNNVKRHMRTCKKCNPTGK